MKFKEFVGNSPLSTACRFVPDTPLNRFEYSMRKIHYHTGLNVIVGDVIPYCDGVRVERSTKDENLS